MAADSEGWTVNGVATARDAFRKANWNDFVRQRFASLADVKLRQPRIRFLGTVPETASDCQCARQRRFLLFTTFLHTEPPLRCLHCNGTMPLYRLPRSTSGEHSALLSWESNYKVCDTLQMNCTVGERFGERQLSDPGSSLSRSGLAVCRRDRAAHWEPGLLLPYRGDTRRPSAELGPEIIPVLRWAVGNLQEATPREVPISDATSAACYRTSRGMSGSSLPDRAGPDAVARCRFSRFAGVLYRPEMDSYGLSNRTSRFTLTLKRYPMGILIVGWTFRFRRVICAPRSAACWPAALPATCAGLG